MGEIFSASNEFMKNLDGDSLSFGFPVPGTGEDSYWVTKSDVSQVTGTVTVETIGGVDVSGATPEAPVEIAAGNTGVVVLTGGTGGKWLCEFNKYSL